MALRTYKPVLKHYHLSVHICGLEDVSFLYRATHLPTQTSVCLKYTDLSISPDSEFLEQLISTVQNTCGCHHANILDYYATWVDREHERLWVVCCDNFGTLKSLMQKHYPTGIPDPAIQIIGRGALLGLEYLHAQKMIHNDIKCANIIITSQGQVKLTGLRQLVHLKRDGGYIPSVFALIGTNIEWAAPEVVTQMSNYTEKADIYALGVSLIEMSCNKTPFDSWEALKILLCKHEYDMPMPSGQQLGHVLHNIVCNCVEKDAKLRPRATHLLHSAYFAPQKRNLLTVLSSIEQINTA